MKEELLNYLLGDLTASFLCAFYMFSLMGVFLSMLFHYGKTNKKKKTKFSFKYWLSDNLVRFFTSVICIFVVARFFDNLPIEMELNMFLGLVVGSSLDQIIVLVRNRTNINIFQK